MISGAFITFEKMLPEVMAPFVTSPKANFRVHDTFSPFCTSSYKHFTYFLPTLHLTYISHQSPSSSFRASPHPVSPPRPAPSTQVHPLPSPRSLSSSAPTATSLRRFPSARPSHIPGIPATYGRHSSPVSRGAQCWRCSPLALSVIQQRRSLK